MEGHLTSRAMEKEGIGKARIGKGKGKEKEQEQEKEGERKRCPPLALGVLKAIATGLPGNQLLIYCMYIIL